MKYWLSFLTTIVTATSSFYSYGQATADKTLISKDVESPGIMQQLHYLQIRQGKQYSYYYPEIKGHQYWGKPIYTLGSLTFEGVVYEDILLNYDIYNDLVMTTLVRNGLTENIILDKLRVDGFYLGDASFVNYRDSSNVLSPGVYQEVFKKDDIQFYIQPKKIVVGNTGRPGEQLNKFIKEETLILVVEGDIHIVKKKKDVLQALAGRPELLNFIKANRLRFNNNDQIRMSLLHVLDRL